MNSVVKKKCAFIMSNGYTPLCYILFSYKTLVIYGLVIVIELVSYGIRIGYMTDMVRINYCVYLTSTTVFGNRMNTSRAVVK